MKLKNSKQVWSLPRGHRIELAFNGRTQPKGDVGGLIPHFLAILATDYRIFPISFASWKTIPQSYKDKCWDIIKVLSFFFNFSFLNFEKSYELCINVIITIDMI